MNKGPLKKSNIEIERTKKLKLSKISSPSIFFAHFSYSPDCRKAYHKLFADPRHWKRRECVEKERKMSERSRLLNLTSRLLNLTLVTRLPPTFPFLFLFSFVVGLCVALAWREHSLSFSKF